MSASWQIGALDLNGLDHLASRLALILRPGDCVTLTGELGSGKTTLARSLIHHIRGDGHDEEVVSPTFALVETYSTPRMEITHIDCFRLEDSSESEELGLDDALDDALVLIEWPKRIVDRLPADRLSISLEEGAHETSRFVTLQGHGQWRARIARLRQMIVFMEASGWGDADAAYLQGDASPRRYGRLARDGMTALLMDSPKQPDGPPIREGKSYSALAHLAEDVRAFAAVTAALRQAGLSAPQIFVRDLDQGFLILEDLGDNVFSAQSANPDMQRELYGVATDVLVMLRKQAPPAKLSIQTAGDYVLPRYDAGALAIEVELLLDWFWPALKGEAVSDLARAEFLELWQAPFDFLAGQPEGWVLRDYHSPNLIWLPERRGIARVGVIDFQDALRGPLAYDLVSLLQDARVDVPAELEADLLEKYCRACERANSTFERDQFVTAYAIVGAQRNSKILGIFARLAARDGKRGYFAHIARVSDYLERNLAHEALAHLKAWYDRYLPSAQRRSIAR